MFNRDDYLSPRLIQAAGLIGLGLQFAFWVYTFLTTGQGQGTTLFIGPCMGLVFVGNFRRARDKDER